MAKKDKNEAKEKGVIIETLQIVITALVIAGIVRSFLFEPFVIPSGSMEPGLHNGDYLFVSKYDYGFSRYSLPFNLPLLPGRIMYRQPERGDVVVFTNIKDGGKDYIKRVMGLPGDTLKMEKGRLYLNGQMLPIEELENYSFLKDKLERYRAGEHVNCPKTSSQVFEQILPEGRKVLIKEQCPAGSSYLDETPEFTVPADHFFFMGDNRDNSLDSRAPDAVGFVHKNTLVGKAQYIFFSIDPQQGAWWQIWNWPWSVRWSRMFTGIY